jgi:hypothetical protein
MVEREKIIQKSAKGKSAREHGFFKNRRLPISSSSETHSGDSCEFSL